jgi:hypothetical protein
MDDYENIERYEEMMSFFDKWKQVIKEANQKANKFLNQLSSEIIQLSIQYYPETKPYKEQFSEPLTEKIKEFGFSILDDIDYMLYPLDDKEYQLPDFKIPVRDQTENERLYREETLKSLPPEQHATFISLDEPRVKQDAFEREFKFLWHDKIKEVLYLNYTEIENFSGNNLRWLDYSTYTCVLQYIDEFYFYAGEYITDRFPFPD